MLMLVRMLSSIPYCSPVMITVAFSFIAGHVVATEISVVDVMGGHCLHNFGWVLHVIITQNAMVFQVLYVRIFRLCRKRWRRVLYIYIKHYCVLENIILFWFLTLALYINFIIFMLQLGSRGHPWMNGKYIAFFLTIIIESNKQQFSDV